MNRNIIDGNYHVAQGESPAFIMTDTGRVPVSEYSKECQEFLRGINPYLITKGGFIGQQVLRDHAPRGMVPPLDTDPRCAPAHRDTAYWMKIR